ncbi:MAG: PIN domain-containing protein [Alphaproteobacteria bacterium]|nr:PIN domain-containing protein [Alphaproteobacteria bacterium]
MILVDTCIWVNHLRSAYGPMQRLLDAEGVAVHPYITGELAIGNLKQRSLILTALAQLPQIMPVLDEEVLLFIEKNSLHGKGLSYVDAHLLASARLSSCLLWTEDKKLKEVAADMQLDAADYIAGCELH